MRSWERSQVWFRLNDEQTCLELYLTRARRVINKKTNDKKCWRECGAWNPHRLLMWQ